MHLFTTHMPQHAKPNDQAAHVFVRCGCFYNLMLTCLNTIAWLNTMRVASKLGILHSRIKCRGLTPYTLKLCTLTLCTIAAKYQIYRSQLAAILAYRGLVTKIALHKSSSRFEARW